MAGRKHKPCKVCGRRSVYFVRDHSVPVGYFCRRHSRKYLKDHEWSSRRKLHEDAASRQTSPRPPVAQESGIERMGVPEWLISREFQRVPHVEGMTVDIAIQQARRLLVEGGHTLREDREPGYTEAFLEHSNDGKLEWLVVFPVQVWRKD